MRNTRAALVLVGLLVLGFAACAILARNHASSSRAVATVTAPATATQSRTRMPAAGGTARQRIALGAVINGFALSYASYLDGDAASRLGAYGTPPVSRQATLDGRIPVDLRDGPLKIASTSGFARTCCSAQETIVLADRSESYPLTVQLLYEQNTWRVTDLTPVDLSMDRHLPKPVSVSTPPKAAAAARAFAVAYVQLRADDARMPVGLTDAARAAIRRGTDSLAGAQLPRDAVRLISVAYGPPSGNELAATATVKDGLSKQTFSYLMVRDRDRWLCAAFL